MSNKGNSRQVQVKTTTSTAPNKMTVTRETTYTTKTTVTLDGPMAGRALKGGNYLSIESSSGGGGYGGNGRRGGGRR